MKPVKLKLIVTLSLFSLFFSIALTSCATSKNYIKVANTWKGIDESRLIATWGRPTKVLDVSGDHKLLIYLEQNNLAKELFNIPEFNDGRHVYGYGEDPANAIKAKKPNVKQSLFGIPLKRSCSTMFKVNKKTNIIEEISIKGNDCKALKPDTT